MEGVTAMAGLEMAEAEAEVGWEEEALELGGATAFQGAQDLGKEEEVWEDAEVAGKEATEVDQEARLAEEWAMRAEILQARLLAQRRLR